VNDIDMLVQWKATIARAEWWVNQPKPYPPTDESLCIADLAAALRAERARVAELEGHLAELDREREAARHERWLWR